MQPLMISIGGTFWDSYIYRGRLYLWNLDGSLEVYRWDELIDSLPNRQEDILAFRCGFSRNDYLYGYDFSLLFNDIEIKEMLLNKFNRVYLEYDLSRNKEELHPFLFGKQNNPFRELPSDIEIFKNNLYVINDDGFFSTTAHRKNPKYPVSSRPRKLWDCPVYAIRAGNNRVALAAGDEGLFEYETADEPYWVMNNSKLVSIDNDIYQLSSNHSSVAQWNYSSIFSSSYVDVSFMAAFKWEERELVFKDLIYQSLIFGESGFSWGLQDKIYIVTKRGLDVRRFVQSNLGTDKTAFEPLQSVEYTDWQGDIVGGGVGLFGTIVETDNALFVFQSNNEVFHINGPITRWRVFPRSIRYENQLHVILKDRINIYSFNHDYFVDQKQKNAGIIYRKPR